MIVLDTNVVSEWIKPAARVLEWVDSQTAESLYITAVTRAELRFGALRLPNGKRKNELAAQLERVLELFKDRTLAFDAAAADQLAQMAADCEKSGRRAVAPDAYIAACAAAQGFAVATRNVRRLEYLSVRLINPWG